MRGSLKGEGLGWQGEDVVLPDRDEAEEARAGLVGEDGEDG